MPTRAQTRVRRPDHHPRARPDQALLRQVAGPETAGDDHGAMQLARTVAVAGAQAGLGIQSQTRDRHADAQSHRLQRTEFPGVQGGEFAGCDAGMTERPVTGAGLAEQLAARPGAALDEFDLEPESRGP
jgi:hypothetical protein